jgi:hypothetical protein
MGFSTHRGFNEFRQIVDQYPWEFCQIQYNILDETNQAGKAGLQYAASKGLGVVIMEPLKGGSLAKTPPKEIQAIWNEAEVKRSPAEWALRWVLDHPEVTVVLSGMNEEKHIEENIRTASEALPHSFSENEIALIGRVREEYRRKLKVGCSGCNYCMPCPSGVNIPGCFESYNNLELGNPMMAKIWYTIINGGGQEGTSKKSYASQCIGCGRCVKKCTQNIDIPHELRLAAQALENSVDARLIRWILMPLFGTVITGVSRWSAMRRARKSSRDSSRRVS